MILLYIELCNTPVDSFFCNQRTASNFLYCVGCTVSALQKCWAMRPFISHQSISIILLLNGVSLCQTLVEKVQQSQWTTQHSQPVMFLLSICHQRPGQLLNYQDCQRHASMPENGSQKDVDVKRFFLHIYDIVLKRLQMFWKVFPLRVQFKFIKADNLLHSPQ